MLCGDEDCQPDREGQFGSNSHWDLKAGPYAAPAPEADRIVSRTRIDTGIVFQRAPVRARVRRTVKEDRCRHIDGDRRVYDAKVDRRVIG